MIFSILRIENINIIDLEDRKVLRTMLTFEKNNETYECSLIENMNIN